MSEDQPDQPQFPPPPPPPAPPPPADAVSRPDDPAVARDPIPVVALGFSLVGGVLVAVPLAVWGLVRTGQQHRRGRGLAIAALCISAAWTVASVAVLSYLFLGSNSQGRVADTSKGLPASGVSTPSTTTPVVSPSSRSPVNAQPTGPMRKSKRIYWHDLKPTMCVRIPRNASAYVTTVDCRAEHQEEVTARTKLAASAKWPGTAATSKAADNKCRLAFEKYVGIGFDDSRLEYDFVTADSTGWREGDRRLICFVLDPGDDHLTRALRGATE